MLKFLTGIVFVLGLFIFFMVTAMTSVPYFTSTHYKNNEAPAYIFRVVLEHFEPSLNQTQFECLRWDDFKEMFRAAEDNNVYICKS